MESEIDLAVEALLRERGSFASGELSERTGRTRQALHHHLKRWVAAGRLVQEGRGRATRYRLGDERSFRRTYTTAGLEEHLVHADVTTWMHANGIDASDAAHAKLAYVVTELVNNAIDHSGSPTVTVRWALREGRLKGSITDNGIGVFERIRSALGLDDALHALQELSKGKLTTWPERHTGEGIFFSSRMLARFELVANGLEWIVDDELGDQAVRAVEPLRGTELRLVLSLADPRTPEQVFARYTHDFEFDTTRCVVRLFEHGRRFVSRSEAKRLLSGLDRFREVILDFTGITGVGQGFVDEIFRVWSLSHPRIHLEPTGMNDVVRFMVERGLPPPDRP